MASRRLIAEATERWEEAIRLACQGLSINEICERLGVTRKAYTRRVEDKNHREWYGRFKAARERARYADKHHNSSFASFRWHYLGYETLPYMHRIVDAIEGARPGEITLILVPPDHAKLVTDREVMLTTHGWRKAVDVKAGDSLFGRDGRPTTVLGVYPTANPELRRVTFTDGTHLDVCVDHNWWVKNRRREVQRKPRRHWEGVMTTAEMEANLHTGDGRPALAIPVCEPIQLPEADLPIDPWLLGYWLGNGTSKANRLHTHLDDLGFVAEQCAAAGFEAATRPLEGHTGEVRLYDFTRRLKALGVWDDKHIPGQYLLASETQRRALLAGLADSDGHVNVHSHQVALVFTNERLAHDAEMLARTLGLKPTTDFFDAAYEVDGERKVTGTAHRIQWAMAGECPFTSPRKSAMWSPAGRQGDRLRWRYVASIEPIPSEPGRCFQVDAPDRLYLAGEQLIVTHNTTLLEDWCTYKLVQDNSFRILVGSETVDHAKKILGRVRERLEPDGPTPEISAKYGPFAPVEGGRSSQPWGATHFNVAGKRASDERDYSMNTVGITGRVQGSRCDLLLLDDVQDVKSLDRSQKYFDIIIQSFLSRPGETGRVVIIGTRCGEFDVYRKLIDANICDHIIKFPAYDVANSPTWVPAWLGNPKAKPNRLDPDTLPPEGMKFLWGPDPDTGHPGRFSPFFYAQKRFQVGEVTWARVYMQRPEAANAMTFSAEVTAAMHDDARGVNVQPRPSGHNKAPVVLSLDPAIGSGNGTLAAAMYPDRMEILDCRLDYDLTAFSQIIGILEEYAWRYTTSTSRIEEVVIEDKAFQRGLLTDDQLTELQARFGFRIVPNTTNREKADPDIGIPAMPASIRRGEITIPWASIEAQEAMAPLLDHLHQWRPGVNGVKLAQDMVMTLWFAWRRWRLYRDTDLHSAPVTTQFNCRPSPLRGGFRPLAVR